MTQRLAVGALAEFVHRRGDLHARLDGRTRAEEGIKVQRKLQRGKPQSYQRERAVSAERDVAGARYTIGGRIDGCDVEARLIEEYKTTRADPDLAHAHHASTHWAQIQLYGALLAEEHNAPAANWTLRLIYGHPDSLATRTFERHLSSTELASFLDETLTWLGSWMQNHQAHVEARDNVLSQLAFPLGDYRPHQRAMARRAYQAMRDRENLLLEAPTGSGKTIGLLYPVVKALASTDHEKVFFLTSRSTGAQAAVAGCRQLDPDQEFLRYVQLINKAQACLVEGMPCDPQRCQYANGYYDRVHDAVSELLRRRAMLPEQVREVAELHRVCPFELSLDAALWADVLIGDYNYVFDPLVHLQRFAENPNIALLIDESHQLSPRTREMLSLTLTRKSVRLALAESLPANLLRRVRAVDRNLVALKRAESVGAEQTIAKPEALLRAIVRLVDELSNGEISLEGFPQARDLAMESFRWARSESWYDQARCIYIAEAEGRDVTLKLVHLDPGPYLKKILSGFGGHIRFSGTLSPLGLYQKLHGVVSGPAERTASPFTAEQLDVLIVDDVPTYWRSRDRSLSKLVALIAEVISARSGNYLVALPSFEYLRSVAGSLAERYPHLNLVAQKPAMSPDERTEFVEHFQSESAQSVGLVVLGGVFAESVDFSAFRATRALSGSRALNGSTIAGVICVGLGLPPPDLERKRLQAYFSSQGGDGHTVAFVQPAMTKIVQMAGRLLRDPEDRGVLCLIDPRFTDPACQRFFPAHWQPKVIRSACVAEHLDNFWQGATGSPRLR
ncbi:MAG: ATP-dependent DNA helicase [Pseudomonadales bacterium]